MNKKNILAALCAGLMISSGPVKAGFDLAFGVAVGATLSSLLHQETRERLQQASQSLVENAQVIYLGLPKRYCLHVSHFITNTLELKTKEERYEAALGVLGTYFDDTFDQGGNPCFLQRGICNEIVLDSAVAELKVCGDEFRNHFNILARHSHLIALDINADKNRALLQEKKKKLSEALKM